MNDSILKEFWKYVLAVLEQNRKHDMLRKADLSQNTGDPAGDSISTLVSGLYLT
jgi:hypothetical protein